MLVCDIDGTLTGPDHALHPKVPSALRALEEAGLPVALATGNVRPVAWGFARQLGISGPLICENGGVVWDWRRGGSPLMLADGSRAREAAEWLADRIEGFDPIGIESNAWRESEWCLHRRENDDAMRRLLDGSEWEDLAIVRTGFAIHLSDPDLHKGRGLTAALSARGVDPARVIAIGDAPNDIPMFELVGHSVAVGNAFDATKEAASVIAKDPSGAAVVELANEILARIS